MRFEMNIPAHDLGVAVAATEGYVIRWDRRGRTADIYSNWSWNARVATLASGGVVLDHGPLDSVQVVDWDWETGGAAADADPVNLLDVLERWIGGQS